MHWIYCVLPLLTLNEPIPPEPAQTCPAYLDKPGYFSETTITTACSIPKNGSVCTSCCTNDMVCCDDGTCMERDQFCRYPTACCQEKYCGDRCCSSDHGIPCGPVCAPQNNETFYECCNSVTGQTCLNTTICCGDGCCDAATEGCCNGKCYSLADETCCTTYTCSGGNDLACCGDGVCCGHSFQCSSHGSGKSCCPFQSCGSTCCDKNYFCADAGTSQCCPNGYHLDAGKCCPSGYSNDGGICCPQGDYNAGGGLCCKQGSEARCGSSCFNVYSQRCCSGSIIIPSSTDCCYTLGGGCNRGSSTCCPPNHSYPHGRCVGGRVQCCTNDRADYCYGGYSCTSGGCQSCHKSCHWWHCHTDCNYQDFLLTNDNATAAIAYDGWSLNPKTCQFGIEQPCGNLCLNIGEQQCCDGTAVHPGLECCAADIRGYCYKPYRCTDEGCTFCQQKTVGRFISKTVTVCEKQNRPLGVEWEGAEFEQYQYNLPAKSDSLKTHKPFSLATDPIVHKYPPPPAKQISPDDAKCFQSADLMKNATTLFQCLGDIAGCSFSVFRNQSSRFDGRYDEMIHTFSESGQMFMADFRKCVLNSFYSMFTNVFTPCCASLRGSLGITYYDCLGPARMCQRIGWGTDPESSIDLKQFSDFLFADEEGSIDGFQLYDDFCILHKQLPNFFDGIQTF